MTQTVANLAETRAKIDAYVRNALPLFEPVDEKAGRAPPIVLGIREELRLSYAKMQRVSAVALECEGEEAHLRPPIMLDQVVWLSPVIGQSQTTPFRAWKVSPGWLRSLGAAPDSRRPSRQSGMSAVRELCRRLLAWFSPRKTGACPVECGLSNRGNP